MQVLQVVYKIICAEYSFLLNTIFFFLLLPVWSFTELSCYIRRNFYVISLIFLKVYPCPTEINAKSPADIRTLSKQIAKWN